MSNQTFRVHPDNPRCFLYQGKPFKIITSAEHYGAVINTDFDYDVYLNVMRRTGENMTRTFTFRRKRLEDQPDMGRADPMVPRPEASILPWQRVSGYGSAGDSLDEFDLERWNPAYFTRLKDFVTKCAQAGVVCEIVLFCNPYRQGMFDYLPCAPVSNINGVGGGIKDVKDYMTLKDPTITAFQDRFIDKIVTELNDFDNVYYEICNEPDGWTTRLAEAEQCVVEWHAHVARTIRQIEARLPKRHLVAANSNHHWIVRPCQDVMQRIVRHENLAYAQNPDIDIVNYHYLSNKIVTEGLEFVRLPTYDTRAGLIWHFLRRRDGFGKPIVFDETFSGVVKKQGRKQGERYAVNRGEAWETILSGGAGYDNLDWTFTTEDETGSGQAPIADGRYLDGRPLRAWYAIFRGLLADYDLAALVPAEGVLPHTVPGYGYAASTDGQGRYVLYLVDERLYRLEPCPAQAMELPLRLPHGTYACRTFDPQTGDLHDLSALESGGDAGTVLCRVPPFAEDVAILLDVRSRR